MKDILLALHTEAALLQQGGGPHGFFQNLVAGLSVVADAAGLEVPSSAEVTQARGATYASVQRYNVNGQPIDDRGNVLSVSGNETSAHPVVPPQGEGRTSGETIVT